MFSVKQTSINNNHTENITWMCCPDNAFVFTKQVKEKLVHAQWWEVKLDDGGYWETCRFNTQLCLERCLFFGKFIMKEGTYIFRMEIGFSKMITVTVSFLLRIFIPISLLKNHWKCASILRTLIKLLKSYNPLVVNWTKRKNAHNGEYL